MADEPQRGEVPAKKRRNPLMLFLMRRGTIFFALMSFLTLFLYFVGVLRQFTELTQLMLLRLLAFFGLSLGVCGIWGIIFDIVLFIRDRRFYSLAKFVITAVGGFWGFVLALFAVFILALTGGNVQ